MDDTYQVIKRSVQAEANGERLDFHVPRYYATFGGRDPITEGAFPDPFVEVWADGSIVVQGHNKRLFLYKDQWKGIIKAVQMALEDEELRMERDREKWLIDTQDAKAFFGTAVDLTRAQTISALKDCKIEIETKTGRPPHNGEYTVPFILFDGHRRQLGRTDLTDDVATGLCAMKTAEEWRKHYARKAKTCMGARLQNGCDNQLGFHVIDSVSDG